MSTPPAPRTRRPCCWCGVPTLSPTAVCSGCVSIDSNADKVPTEADALPAGDWRFDPFRRVKVFVPAPVPKLEKIDPKALACIKCRARADQSCRTKNGHHTSDHGVRTIPRCCPCGAPVQLHRQKCDGCKVKVRRAGQATRRRQQAEKEWAA